MPRLKKSAVTIALVPEDVGKPTLKLEKVAVQDGSCLWENPVYETVKMIREIKTGKLSEKIYHFVVSNVIIPQLFGFSSPLFKFPLVSGFC